mgnify:CR=1 FL=1
MRFQESTSPSCARVHELRQPPEWFTWERLFIDECHESLVLVERLFADTTWDPKRVTSAFTFAAPIEFLAGGNIRTNGMDPLGCLGDLGWYLGRSFCL